VKAKLSTTGVYNGGNKIHVASFYKIKTQMEMKIYLHRLFLSPISIVIF